MSAISSLINISLADKRDVFLLCNYEPARVLRIYLINVNDCEAFSGHATDVDLRSQAAKIQLDFRAFMSLTKKALTKNEADGNNYLYCLEKNCEHFTFTWKSIDSEETIVSIGSMKVSQADYASVIKDVLLTLATELSNLNSKVMVMEQELVNANIEKENAVKLVNDTVDLKEQMEKELFSKFLLVLNEKKEKIRELKCDNSSSSGSKTVEKNKKTTLIRRVHAVSDSSDDDVTDNEKINVASTSNSKRKESLMFFDEGEPSRLPSPSKKRNRNQKTVSECIRAQECKSKEKFSDLNQSESDDDLLSFL